MIAPSLLLKQDPATVEILIDPSPRDPERVRKLEYVVTELAREERADDHAFLAGIKRDLLRRG